MESSILSPIIISLKVAFSATAINIIIGLAIAYILAKYEFFGKNLIDALIMQPLIMPPTVLGYYLLVLLGRQSALGLFLEDTFGIRLIFNLPAAIIAASIASLPLFIKPVKSAFESVNDHIEDSARLLGNNEWEVFINVTLPLAQKGILAGAALSFARALGEFGTTLMVAGNIPGKTQTLSLAIYDAVQSGDNGTANLLVGITTLISITILYVVNSFFDKKI